MLFNVCVVHVCETYKKRFLLVLLTTLSLQMMKLILLVLITCLLNPNCGVVTTSEKRHLSQDLAQSRLRSLTCSSGDGKDSNTSDSDVLSIAGKPRKLRAGRRIEFEGKVSDAVNSDQTILDKLSFSDSRNHSNPKPNAYLTLCAYDRDVFNTLVLFEQLRRVNSSGAFAVMIIKINAENELILKRSGIRIHQIPRKLNITIGYVAEGIPSRDRDEILWNKLYVWALTDYHKVVFLDADLVIMNNIDSIFEFDGDLVGSPMISPEEKILFFEPCVRKRTIEQSLASCFLRNWQKLDASWAKTKKGKYMTIYPFSAHLDFYL